ncbi:hypothetical protein L1887_23786 [Cichorium endivia]|nr:hypothetical protein L1887_23786 [Cichorium endivia]
MTNENTYIDGFSSLKLDDITQTRLTRYFRESLTPIKRMISNCLAITNYLEKIGSRDSFTDTRLLFQGIYLDHVPSWMTVGDTRLISCSSQMLAYINEDPATKAEQTEERKGFGRCDERKEWKKVNVQKADLEEEEEGKLKEVKKALKEWRRKKYEKEKSELIKLRDRLEKLERMAEERGLQQEELEDRRDTLAKNCGD